MTIDLQTDDITIKTIQETDLKNWWSISFGPQSDLQWTKFDAPYFEQSILDWPTFEKKIGLPAIQSKNRALIFYQEKMIGMTSAYWEDGHLKKWLECGIVIYASAMWGKGIGEKTMKLWLAYLFELQPDIQRIGFTTWSGNVGMMRIGEKLGMTLEAKIRKVRYTNEQYYDSIKYGILREELPLLNK